MASNSFHRLSVLFVVGWLACLPTTPGYSTGAPESQCESMTPNHPGVSLPLQDSPYNIKLSTNEYIPFQVVTVTIEASELYAGFMLQARDADDVTSFVGDFQPADNTQFVCERHGLTHTSATLKQSQSFIWRAPLTGNKNVIFRLTVVQNYRDYFVDIRSDVLRHKDSNQPQTTSQNAPQQTTTTIESTENLLELTSSTATSATSTSTITSAKTTVTTTPETTQPSSRQTKAPDMISTESPTTITSTHNTSHSMQNNTATQPPTMDINNEITNMSSSSLPVTTTQIPVTPQSTNETLITKQLQTFSTQSSVTSQITTPTKMAADDFLNQSTIINNQSFFSNSTTQPTTDMNKSISTTLQMSTELTNKNINKTNKMDEISTTSQTQTDDNSKDGGNGNQNEAQNATTTKEPLENTIDNHTTTVLNDLINESTTNHHSNVDNTTPTSTTEDMESPVTLPVGKTTVKNTTSSHGEGSHQNTLVDDDDDENLIVFVPLAIVGGLLLVMALIVLYKLRASRRGKGNMIPFHMFAESETRSEVYSTTSSS